MEMKDVSNFVTIVLAKLTGDKAAEIAARNEKKARAALKGQISSLESEQVNLEEKVEDCKEALQNAIYRTEPINSSEAYIKGIADAQEDLDEAVEKLENNKAAIEYYKDLLAKL